MIYLLICSIIIIIIIAFETAFAGKIMAYDAKHYRLFKIVLVSPLQSCTVSFHFFSEVYFSFDFLHSF